MNKRVFFSFCILISLCVTYSCSKKESEALEYQLIDIELENNPIYLSSLLNGIKPILFETNESSLVGEAPNLIFTKESIFIKSNSTIIQFDSEGKYINTINKRGNGAGEYTAISDFFINEELNRVEILDKRQKKVLYYNYNGEYIHDQQIGVWAIKIFRDSENRLYIYSGYERDEDNIFQFNVYEGEQNHSFSEIYRGKSEFLHISNRLNFFKSARDKILFFEPFNDTIYALERDRLIPKFVLSYNGQNIPQSFYAKNKFSNVFDFFQELKKHNYVNSTYNVIETGNKLLFYCMKESKRYLVVYDKIKKKAFSFDRIIDDVFSNGVELPFQDGEFILFAQDNRVLFLIHPSWFINNSERIIVEDFKVILNKLNEEDNPVGLFGYVD